MWLIIFGLILSYILYRIGKKINEEKLYPWYLIPIRVFWTLVINSNTKVVDIFILLIIIDIYLSSSNLYVNIDSSIEDNMFYAFFVIFFINFFGSLARSLNKSYWFYGLLSLFLIVHPRFIFLPLLMLAFNFIDNFFTFKNLYKPSSKGKMELNKNEIKKYLLFILLSVGAYYGGEFYDEIEKNWINEKYEMLCDENISNYDTLSVNVYDWINETQHNLTADSLSYLMLSSFITDMEYHESTMDFFYILMQYEKNIYNNFNYAFNKAFFKVMKLKEVEKKSFKKENICHIYQKYIINMATSKVNINEEIEKFCDGLIVPKRFEEESLKTTDEQLEVLKE